jgi:hypothetical protein
MVVCACLVVIAAVAVVARGCGNPGEGTVTVDRKLGTKYGKHLRVSPFADGKKTPEPNGIKSRPRTDAAKKQRRLP